MNQVNWLVVFHMLQRNLDSWWCKLRDDIEEMPMDDIAEPLLDDIEEMLMEDIAETVLKLENEPMALDDGRRSIVAVGAHMRLMVVLVNVVEHIERGEHEYMLKDLDEHDKVRKWVELVLERVQAHGVQRFLQLGLSGHRRQRSKVLEKHREHEDEVSR